MSLLLLVASEVKLIERAQDLMVSEHTDYGDLARLCRVYPAGASELKVMDQTPGEFQWSLPVGGLDSHFLYPYCY